SSGEYLPGSLQGKISSDGCLKKEQMVVSAIASTPFFIDVLGPEKRRRRTTQEKIAIVQQSTPAPAQQENDGK
ncbi:hypothetical protein, partial [Shigella sonnei]|uniref:hypothetical protein n=1 Tax=Shigella sonnei TaxID=624 RepID=UPI003F49164A